MWTNSVFTYAVDILLSAFAVYLFIYYFDIFFVRKKNKRSLITGLALFALWQYGVSSIIDLPAYANISVTIIVTLISVMFIYESTRWKKCVFVIAFNAIWMLMETLCVYFLLIYCEKIAYIQSVGSFVSKIFFALVIFALKKVFTDEEIKELPAKYS
ncbi:ATP-binding protein, partial [Mediterraneibacter glycyrrhizinilyticus]|nr:ATP-binding protein [Mediterraneibacter glycyrrhizinilyticus]